MISISGSHSTIFPADAFIIPFESTKAVKSYASVYQLLLKRRPGGDYWLLHVLSNLTRLPGLRRRVLALARRGRLCGLL